MICFPVSFRVPIDKIADKTISDITLLTASENTYLTDHVSTRQEDSTESSDLGKGKERKNNKESSKTKVCDFRSVDDILRMF